MNFRVVAVNIAGRSPPAVLAQPVTVREIMGTSYEKNIMIRKSEFIQLLYMCHFMLSATVCSANCHISGIVILPVMFSYLA